MNEGAHLWSTETLRGRRQPDRRSPREFRCELCRRPTLILPVCAQCTEAQIEQKVSSYE